ncbi:hypothetical protein VTK56DRAFT_3067 [Thermocarpiscus australiensis]
MYCVVPAKRYLKIPKNRANCFISRSAPQKRIGCRRHTTTAANAEDCRGRFVGSPVLVRFRSPPVIPKMARLRLGYTKSRTGCLRCKARRVKCDENRPCKACLRHGVECSLVSSQPKGAALAPDRGNSHPSTRRTQRPLQVRAINPELKPDAQSLKPSGDLSFADGSSLTLTPESPLKATPDPFPYLAKFVTNQPEADAADWVFDLELLHHFTTSTYKTLSMSGPQDETERLWQIEVPKLAFVHVFLLHQILAFSCLHLAYLHPHRRQEYSLRASHHQTVGIRGMRMALANISTENCHALFAAAIILFVSALAASSTNSDAAEGPAVDKLVDVWLLVKGIGSVLNSSHHLLRAGPLSELFAQRGDPEQVSVTLNRVILALEDFLAHLVETEPDRTVRAVIHSEAERLVAAIREAVVRTMAPEYRVVAAWPILMSDDLVPLLRGRNQAALALLSYYCVVFHAAESQYWFMKGWASAVARDISRATVGSPWDRHSAWALGWITSHEIMG